MALGYDVQACSYVDGWCSNLARCLTGNHDIYNPAQPNPCGPPDLKLAESAFRLACASMSDVCTSGPRALAEARQWRKFFSTPPTAR